MHELRGRWFWGERGACTVGKVKPSLTRSADPEIRKMHELRKRWFWGER
jgi:hypothetical protein